MSKLPRTHTAVWTVPHDHPALPGHFPGAPIVPGVLLVALALEHAAAGIDAAWVRVPTEIASMKFLAPLRPGDTCTFELEATTQNDDSAQLRVDIRRGETLAVSGVVTRASVGSPGAKPS